jgi:hypothetical protein
MLIALYVITAVNVLVAAGFGIAGIVRPKIVTAGESTEASRIFALYAAARAVPLAIVTLAAIFWGDLNTIMWLGALAGIIQLLDGGIGLSQRDMGKTIGPLVIAVLQLAALVAMHVA